jgi:hypothetical protein
MGDKVKAKLSLIVPGSSLGRLSKSPLAHAFARNEQFDGASKRAPEHFLMI